MAIDHIASRDVVGTPECAEDLLAAERLAGIGREQIEQCLFHRRQYRPTLSDLDLLIQQVDLQPADLDDGNERHVIPVAPSHQCEGPSDELLGYERHRDDVVRAFVKGGELCLEVSSDAEHDRRNASVGHALSDELQLLGVTSVEIDEQKMRPPPLELRPGGFHIGRDMGLVLTVIQSQGDEIREWLIDHDQHSRGPAELVSTHVASLGAR